MLHDNLYITNKDAHITLHYRLGSKKGYDIVNTFGAHPATFQLNTGQLAKTLEKCLIGLAEGAHRTFELPEQDAFGPRNVDLVQYVSIDLLKEQTQDEKEYQIGDWIQLFVPGKGNLTGIVREINEMGVQVDFNHPLAGQAIEFEVQIIGIL